ncbi:MAG: GGDEF domain-containing protein [Deltaproteobacteria bacterium]|jgi:diguanylate cyclase (GGDEF)-like protein|nr:GGDEF domain-containing protein [Deltaproteobacteria bacterium]
MDNPGISTSRHLQPDQTLPYIEEDDSRRYAVNCRICSLCSLLFFGFLSLVNLAQGRHVPASAQIICAGVSLLCLVLARREDVSRLIPLLLCSAHITLAWFMFAAGGYKLWGMFWTFACPQIFILLLGLGKGAILSLFFILSLLALNLQPMQDLMHNRYPPEDLGRYFTVLSGLSALALFSELIRRRLKEKLLLLHRQINGLALTDPLTGLGNRLAFEQCLQTEYARFLRNNESFCLLMGDIDNFKRLNDQYGHAAGDAVLRHVAEAMLRRVRRQDGVFRWGGEEFMIIVLGVKQKDIANVAEQLRLAVFNSPCLHEGKSISCSISFGAYYCRKNETIEQALEKVDSLLYAAKESGRNRIMIDASQVV